MLTTDSGPFTRLFFYSITDGNMDGHKEILKVVYKEEENSQGSYGRQYNS